MDKRVFKIGGNSTEFNLTHNLGTPDVVVVVRENKIPGELILAGVTILNENEVKISISPATDENNYVVTIIG